MTGREFASFLSFHCGLCVYVAQVGQRKSTVRIECISVRDSVPRVSTLRTRGALFHGLRSSSSLGGRVSSSVQASISLKCLGSPEMSNSSSNSELCRSDVSIRLFGVELLPRPPAAAVGSAAAAMRKCVSLGNLMHCGQEHLDSADGYQSDGLMHSSAGARARRKGVPWSEDEHRAFLLGLQKLGKGDWRGISRNFVKTRTPTQVASHAQKYFIRQSNLSKRKRRSSLFDISPENKAPVLQLSLSQEPTSQDKAYTQEHSRTLLNPEVHRAGAPQATTFSLNSKPELNVFSSKPPSDDTRLTLGLALEPSLWTINLQQPASACHVNPSFAGLGFVSSIQCT